MKIYASVLSCVESNSTKTCPLQVINKLKKVIHQINGIHIDLMDGQYVPGNGVSHEIALKIRENIDLPMQIHAMVNNVDNYIITNIRFIGC